VQPDIDEKLNGKKTINCNWIYISHESEKNGRTKDSSIKQTINRVNGAISTSHWFSTKKGNSLFYHVISRND